jgi:hypothetical protein
VSLNQNNLAAHVAGGVSQGMTGFGQQNAVQTLQPVNEANTMVEGCV